MLVWNCGVEKTYAHAAAGNSVHRCSLRLHTPAGVVNLDGIPSLVLNVNRSNGCEGQGSNGASSRSPAFGCGPSFCSLLVFLLLMRQCCDTVSLIGTTHLPSKSKEDTCGDASNNHLGTLRDPRRGSRLDAANSALACCRHADTVP